jgi:hypothetical protein
METFAVCSEPGKTAAVLDLGSLWLTYQGPIRTVPFMGINLTLDDRLMERLQEEAAKRGCSVSDLVEEALRRLLESSGKNTTELPPFPTFRSGGALVDISDRDALYRAMEGF